MDRGLGNTLLLSAFSTIVTYRERERVRDCVVSCVIICVCVCVYLSQRDDELTQVFFAAGEADVIVRNKHLSNDVHLGERSPERAVCVAVQTLFLRESEQRSVALVLRPRIQISETYDTLNLHHHQL